MVGQQLLQTNEKYYSVPQCPMWLFLPLFYGFKHSRRVHGTTGAVVREVRQRSASTRQRHPTRPPSLQFSTFKLELSGFISHVWEMRDDFFLKMLGALVSHVKIQLGTHADQHST